MNYNVFKQINTLPAHNKLNLFQGGQKKTKTKNCQDESGHIRGFLTFLCVSQSRIQHETMNYNVLKQINTFLDH